MKDVNTGEENFELDYEQVAELRRRALQEARAQANVVDGDTIQSDDNDSDQE